MNTIPIDFLRVSRTLKDVVFRVRNSAMQAQSLDRITITARLDGPPPPDFPCFTIDKWPSMDDLSTVLRGRTLYSTHQGKAQRTNISTPPTRGFLDELQDYAEPPPPDEDNVTADMCEQYAQLLPFASTDGTRLVLNGIYHGDHLVATDGRRLAYSPSPLSCTPFVLPNHIIKILLGLHGKKPSAFWIWKTSSDTSDVRCDMSIATDRYEINFDIDRMYYPNWKQVLPDETAFPGIHIQPHPSALPELRKWLKGKKSVTFTSNETGATAYDLDSGNSLDFEGLCRGTAVYNGEFMSACLTPHFTTLQAIDGESPAWFHAGVMKGVLMPIRSCPEAIHARLTDTFA